MPATRNRFVVPRAALALLVDNLHVSTSEYDVECEVRSRLKEVATEYQMTQCVDYALRRHLSNRKTYLAVMKGR